MKEQAVINPNWLYLERSIVVFLRISMTVPSIRISLTSFSVLSRTAVRCPTHKYLYVFWACWASLRMSGLSTFWTHRIEATVKVSSGWEVSWAAELQSFRRGSGQRLCTCSCLTVHRDYPKTHTHVKEWTVSCYMSMFIRPVQSSGTQIHFFYLSNFFYLWVPEMIVKTGLWESLVERHMRKNKMTMRSTVKWFS